MGGEVCSRNVSSRPLHILFCSRCSAAEQSADCPEHQSKGGGSISSQWNPVVDDAGQQSYRRDMIGGPLTPPRLLEKGGYITFVRRDSCLIFIFIFGSLVLPFFLFLSIFFFLFVFPSHLHTRGGMWTLQSAMWSCSSSLWVSEPRLARGKRERERERERVPKLVNDYG